MRIGNKEKVDLYDEIFAFSVLLLIVMIPFGLGCIIGYIFHP